MKTHLLWPYDRGSFQWDIMCLLILTFLFLIPRDSFTDIPEFMKMPASGTLRTTEKDGTTIFTSKLDTPHFLDTYETRRTTLGTLEHDLGIRFAHEPRIVPIRDWTGRVIGYAVWKKEEKP